MFILTEGIYRCYFFSLKIGGPEIQPNISTAREIKISHVQTRLTRCLDREYLQDGFFGLEIGRPKIQPNFSISSGVAPIFRHSNTIFPKAPCGDRPFASPGNGPTQLRPPAEILRMASQAAKNLGRLE